ncbi:MAG: oligosaccharide flippase family protein [Erysipelotrichales bacterium]|nr:oligosaccharide flippase family protein [Erysipelotrichales bacterium]
MKKNVVKNTTMLYLMSAAKLVLPLITIPYLSNVLSTEAYGTTVFVKSIMTTMQIVVDFAFGFSGTRAIALARDNKEETEKEAARIFTAQLILALGCSAVMVGMAVFMPSLKGMEWFAVLSFIPVFLSIYLRNYFFRGLEKMEVLTYRYFITKSISTVLTFVLIHGDADLMMVAYLDIFTSVIAAVVVTWKIKQLGYKIGLSNIREALVKLGESTVYFVSNIATTAFGALNTMLVGIYLTKTDAAYWGNAMVLISAILALYDPITDGIYPEMMRCRDLKYLRKVLLIFMPLIIAGCIFSFYAAPAVLGIFGKEKYISAIPIFRRLIPVLLFSFPAQLLGWPGLGAVSKTKQTTASTIIAALFQCGGLALLGITGNFTLISLATLRCVTEFFLLALRGGMVLYYRKDFVHAGSEEAA